MGYLTIPCRIFYESKGTTGLTNIKAMVFKPNSSLAGPYNLTELPAPLLGLYYFDYLTSEADPQGEYLIVIASPTENVRDPVREGIYALPGGGNAADLSRFITPQLIGKVNANPVVNGTVKESDTIEASLNNPDILGVVQDDASIGVSLATDDNVLANSLGSGTIIGNVSDEENIT